MSGSISYPATLPGATDTPQREHGVLAKAWRGARRVLDHMIDLLDPPAVIASRGTVGPNTRQIMRDWLRNLEILVRRLLFITALGLTLPPPRRAGGDGGGCNTHPFNLDDPSSWKVSLRFFRSPGERRERVPQSAASRDDQKEWRALPFALRLEALHRVIARPERRARAVARMFARIGAANAGRNSPRLFSVRHWHIHRSVRTPAQESISDLMDGTEALAVHALACWQEPG